MNALLRYLALCLWFSASAGLLHAKDATDDASRPILIASADGPVHHCVQVMRGGLYGGFVNTCDFKVEVVYCAIRPREDAWTSAFNCEKNQFGATAIGPRRQSADHTHGAEMIAWFASRAPSTPVRKQFVGNTIRAACSS